MAPIKSFACSFENCDSTFTKPSELKKHEVAHRHPEKIFRCTRCPFITLQKKNLQIHMSRHTGEKRFQCPHTVPSVDSGSPSEGTPMEMQCDFRTSDPAALTRHRKVHHGYIPTRRGRLPRASSSPSSATASTSSTTAPKIETVERRASFLVPTDMNGAGSDVASPDMELTEALEYGYDGADAGLVAREEDMALDSYFYPTNYSYSDPMEISPELQDFFYGPDSTLDTGREACLCPDWMVEAGIEGWDDSVLAAHSEYYAA